MAKTIGVLVIDLEGAYSNMIWPEIARTTRAQGHDCLILPANNPRYPHPEEFLTQFNSLFNFIHPDVIDALVVVGNTFINHLEPAAAKRMIEKLKELVPLVSLNQKIEGAPCVLVDESIGIRKAVEHLVRHHNHTRIGFIEGPTENNENILRKAAFIDAMKQEELEPKDDSFFLGDFTVTTAYRLAQRYGKFWVNNFDALMTANDYTAVGIIQGLNEQGYSVPGDIAIIGFDDIAEAPYNVPSLSTISQPFERMTRAAAQTAIHLCEGRSVPMETMFHTEFRVRASCGCTHFLCDRVSSLWSLPFGHQDITGNDKDRKGCSPYSFTEELSSAYEQVLGRLYEFVCTHEAEPENISCFLIMLEEIIDSEEISDSSYNTLPDFLFLLKSRLYRENPHKLKEWRDCDLFEQCLVLVSRKQDFRFGHHELDIRDSVFSPLRSIQLNMSTITSLRELFDLLHFNFIQLGLKNCFVSLLKDGPEEKGLFSWLLRDSRMVFVLRDGIREESITVDNPVIFPTMKVWPDSMKPVPAGNIRTVVPLFYREKLYGFFGLEIRNFSGFFTESIRLQLSLTVHRCYLNSEREKAESRLQALLREYKTNNRQLIRDSLADELTGLYNRRGFIQNVESMLEAKTGESVRFCLAFSDMDGLKSINDNLGHPEGDQAIRDMAEILKGIFRENDILARIGGDEFIAFSLEVPENISEILEARIHEEIKAFSARASRPYRLSLSSGFVVGFADSGKIKLNELMKKADDSLYRNKRKKNRENE